MSKDSLPTNWDLGKVQNPQLNVGSTCGQDYTKHKESKSSGSGFKKKRKVKKRAGNESSEERAMAKENVNQKQYSKAKVHRPKRNKQANLGKTLTSNHSPCPLKLCYFNSHTFI